MTTTFLSISEKDGMFIVKVSIAMSTESTFQAQIIGEFTAAQLGTQLGLSGQQISDLLVD